MRSLSRASHLLRLGALLAPFCLAACNGSHHGQTAFDPLVTNLINDDTNETGTPIEVEGKTFSFPDSDTAFDDVLPADTGSVVD